MLESVSWHTNTFGCIQPHCVPTCVLWFAAEDVTGSWKRDISFTRWSLCPPWCGDGRRSTPWLVVSLSHVQTSWNGSHRKDGRLSCEGTYTSLLNWQCSLGRQGTVCDNMMLTFHFYEMIVEQNNCFHFMIHGTVRVLLCMTGKKIEWNLLQSSRTLRRRF